MKTSACFSLATMVIASFASCSNNNEDGKDIIKDFALERESIVITNGQPASLKVLSGNNDYTVSFDEAIIESSRRVSSDENYGSIPLIGKVNGETTIRVRDNITGQDAEVNVKVVDAYMSLTCLGHYPAIGLDKYDKPTEEAIKNSIMGKASIPAESIFILVKNDGKSFYFFESEADYKKGEIAFSGTYEFTLIDNVPYITYKYMKDRGEIVLTSQISNDANNVSSIIAMNDFFNLKWDIPTLQPTRGGVAVRSQFETFQDFTNAYKVDYEIVKSVLLKTAFIYAAPGVSDMPDSL